LFPPDSITSSEGIAIMVTPFASSREATATLYLLASHIACTGHQNIGAVARQPCFHHFCLRIYPLTVWHDEKTSPNLSVVGLAAFQVTFDHGRRAHQVFDKSLPFCIVAAPTFGRGYPIKSNMNVADNNCISVDDPRQVGVI
jgi:hypothetical protein